MSTDGPAGETASGTIDHVAIEVTDLDERVAWMVAHLGLAVRRVGRLRSDPSRRIAMLADRRGVKLELIESPAGVQAKPDILRHLAFDVDDVGASEAALVDAGATRSRPTHRFDAARSWTAVVQPPSGVEVQLVHYDDDSPDR